MLTEFVWTKNTKFIFNEALTVITSFFLRCFAWTFFTAWYDASWLPFAFRQVGASVMLATTFLICWPCVESYCIGCILLLANAHSRIKQQGECWGCVGLLQYVCALVSSLMSLPWTLSHSVGLWYLLRPPSACQALAYCVFPYFFATCNMAWPCILMLITLHEISVCLTQVLSPVHEKQNSAYTMQCAIPLVFLVDAWVAVYKQRSVSIFVISTVIQPVRLPLLHVWVHSLSYKKDDGEKSSPIVPVINTVTNDLNELLVK